MNKRTLLITFTSIFIWACNSNKIREVVLDDNTKVVGNISKDTIYDGLVKFYSLQTGKLISDCNYTNGKENGDRTDYYDNGRPSMRAVYENGKMNGMIRFFSKTGHLDSESFQYYDLSVGPVTIYSENKLHEFDFYSFEGKNLMSLNYDSIGSKKLVDILQDFFFFNKQSYVANGERKSDNGTEVFLYLIYPPKYDFKYSLVEVDDKLTIKSEVEKLESKLPWINFDVDSAKVKRKELAIRIVISDSNDTRKVEMLKVI